jgi:hypothetical protein
MIWRVLGWLTLIYAVLAGLVTVVLAATGTLFAPAVPVDDAFVPPHAAGALWLHTSHVWFPAAVVALLPAPAGFFRRARGAARGRGLLAVHAAAGLALCAAIVGVPAYLCLLGPIRTGPEMWLRFTYRDVLAAAGSAAMLALPALAAVCALRSGRPSAARIGAPKP